MGQHTADTEERKKNLSARAAALVAALIVICMSVLLFVLPPKEYSQQENRMLAKLPAFTWDTLQSGSWMDGITSYASDHFPMRDAWIQVRCAMLLAQGRQEMNGIYLAKDGYLIGDYPAPQNTDRIKATFAKFAEKVNAQPNAPHVMLMLVPTAVTILEDKLPANAPVANQRVVMQEIAEAVPADIISVYDHLAAKKTDVQLFYRTDHHWTTRGAYEGYLAYCDVAQLTAIPLETFEVKEATTQFHGTYASKVNLPWEQGDVITLYTYPGDALSVRYEDTGEVSDSLYAQKYLQEKDKYSVFLNNLHPLVVIENQTSATDKNLVLVKDSYANSMIPFLTHHYDTIYVFDTRYYRDSVSSFIASHTEVTDVLILYNMSTIDTDTGVRGIF